VQQAAEPEDGPRLPVGGPAVGRRLLAAVPADILGQELR
jgi:hypothetical protein